MFKVGDKVEWESQAVASWTIKRGKVVAVVPAGRFPTDILTAINKFWKTMFDWPTLTRNHESYLVEVPGGKTSKAMPKLYWPHASKLKLEAKDG